MYADHYYGNAVAGYDEHRRKKPEWEREQKAVEDFVEFGPVLDVPIGTGRYLDIYRAKGLECVGLDLSCDMIAEARKHHLWLDARVGNILNMPFESGVFATAVCSRMLNWFYPDDMALAVFELKRVAHCLVVSIRHGDEGDTGNYTHNLAKFYAAIDGLYIERRRVIREVEGGTFEMFKLRRARLDDVLVQFSEHENGLYGVDRLARIWTDYLGLPSVDWRRVAVRAEYWTSDRLGELVHAMAVPLDFNGKVNEMITELLPRRDNQPLTILRVGGRDVMLDGRRRANKWMRVPGSYPVLMIEEPSSC